MKLLLIGCVVIFTAFILLFIHQGKLSQTGKAPGLINGKLAACPKAPNCICSEFPNDTSHYVAPLHLPNLKAGDALLRSSGIITAMGGSITQTTDTYLAATFTSSVFHFIDDFEVRWDPGTELLHVRSASRVGYSDVGINKKRTAQFLDSWRQ